MTPKAHPDTAAPYGWTAGVSLAFVACYWLSNRLTSVRADVGDAVFGWERAIPFVPWTIVPYLSICGFFVLSFFVGRDLQELQRHIARLLLVLVISISCYLLFPLQFTFERPATSGALGLLFQALTAFDLPYNRAPSLHICVLLVLWVRFVPHVRGWQRWGLHVWFGLIAVSVLTTYQHHFIDVPAGFAVAGLCITLTARRQAQRR